VGTARVSNISPKGVSLTVTEFIEVGTVLNLELQAVSGTASVTRLASVTRVISHPAGEWSLGCNFISRLNEQELAALL
jgi:hypothetical protein